MKLEAQVSPSRCESCLRASMSLCLLPRPTAMILLILPVSEFRLEARSSRGSKSVRYEQVKNPSGIVCYNSTQSALHIYMLVVVGSAVPSVAHHYQDPLIPRSKARLCSPAMTIRSHWVLDADSVWPPSLCSLHSAALFAGSSANLWAD